MKSHIFQVSLRVFKDFFQTFPHLWSVSRLFKARKISTLNSMTFQPFPGSVWILNNGVHSHWRWIWDADTTTNYEDACSPSASVWHSPSCFSPRARCVWLTASTAAPPPVPRSRGSCVDRCSDDVAALPGPTASHCTASPAHCREWVGE